MHRINVFIFQEANKAEKISVLLIRGLTNFNAKVQVWDNILRIFHFIWRVKYTTRYIYRSMLLPVKNSSEVQEHLLKAWAIFTDTNLVGSAQLRGTANSAACIWVICFNIPHSCLHHLIQIFYHIRQWTSEQYYLWMKSDVGITLQIQCCISISFHFVLQ